MGRYINNNTTSINSLKRIGWIDNLRGFCMLAILLDHTESYYLDYHIINQNLYLTDALVFFFILSGYLMYKPQQQFCIAHKMKSICRQHPHPAAEDTRRTCARATCRRSRLS